MIENFLIPLANIPQQFQILLAGVTYIMTCKWNDAPDAGWALDFDDAVSGDPIAYNLPLITGANILDGLEYLGFNGALYIYNTTGSFDVPTLDNLGIEALLFFQVVSNG